MKAFRPSWGLIILSIVLLAILAFSVGGLAVAWRMAGNTAMSVHGYVALAIGVVASLALGGGLMALAFFSSRRGYDDEQGR